MVRGTSATSEPGTQREHVASFLVDLAASPHFSICSGLAPMNFIPFSHKVEVGHSLIRIRNQDG